MTARRSPQSNKSTALLVDVTVGSVLHNAAALAGSTEFTFVSDFTFTVQRPGSLIEITTRGGGQVQLVATGLITSRGYLDTSTVYYLGGQRVMVANEFANPFTGFAGLWIPNLAVGNHTFNFKLLGEANGSVYMRHNGYEEFAYQVIEHFNRGST